MLKIVLDMCYSWGNCLVILIFAMVYIQVYLHWRKCFYWQQFSAFIILLVFCCCIRDL